MVRFSRRNQKKCGYVLGRDVVDDFCDFLFVFLHRHREPIHSCISIPAKRAGKLGVVILCKEASDWTIMERHWY